MNRLIDSSYDGRKESFTYDKVGNRLTKTTEDITEKYVYNVKNQLKELHNKAGVTFFTHDKQGNTIKEQTSNGNNVFEYNTLNQQVKAITKDNNTLVSRYDSEGLRYEIEENEKLTKFIYNKKGNTYSHAFVGVSSTDQNKFWGVTYDEVLVETDKDDNVVSRFTRGYDVVAADISDNKYYYSVDEQGSTELITDVSGNVKNEYRYDAFGNVLESKEEVHNRITYTGQQFDGITAQYYLRARYYNPVIGRFTQEDVYRGDGLNLYAYCGNNPVGYWDPSGYECNTKASSFGRMTAEEGKRYNGYWDNVKASKGMLDDYNKAILKYDKFGDYYEVKLKFEQGVKWGTETLDMDKIGFDIKASRLEKLSNSNQLYKITPNRDPSITRNYKNAIIKSVKIKYKDDIIKAKTIIKQIKQMDPDHVWELQLGGPDSWENLEMVDSFTNRRIGQNLASQMRGLDEGVRIKIVVQR